MAGGAQGNFNMQRPGFTPGGVNDPAQGGSGYTMGGSASWGGNYGNQINPGVGVGYQNYLPSMGSGNPWDWNVPYNGPALGVGGTGKPPVPSIQNPGNPGLPYVQNPGMSVMPNGPENIRNPFANVSSGRLAEAQRLAGLGKMGRARQQIERGGGTWNTDIHKALKSGLTGS